MYPLEILNKIRQLKTPTSRKKFLGTLPPDDEFWFGAAHALNIFNTCYPLILPNYKDPEYHGNGVPSGIFERIVKSILRYKEDSYKTVKVLNAFSTTCTEDEWEQWYKPILTGCLFIPISVKDFVKVAPDAYATYAKSNFIYEDLEMTPLEDMSGNISPHSVEPLYDSPRVIIFLGGRVAAFLPDGLRVDHPKLKEMVGIMDRTMVPLFIDSYLESEEIIIFRDVYSASDLFHGSNKIKLSDRHEIIGQMADLINNMGVSGIDVVERYAKDDGLRENAQTLLEQGYRGLIFTEDLEHLLNPVIAHPTKKNVLTCLDIISGEGEYSDKVEYIVARGNINKKKVETNVFYGLNWQQRDTYFKGKDQLIGKRFEIVSCGLSKNDKLIMPIFKQWRK